jgi:heme exporter protein C
VTERFRWFTFAAPALFHALAGRLIPWLWTVAAPLAAAGLYIDRKSVV